MITRTVGLSPAVARWAVVSGAALLSVPLLLGIWRLAQRLGAALAEAALPRGRAGVDFDAAPRRALVMALQLGVALVAGLLVLAVTQPFLPGYSGFVLLGVIAVIYGVAFLRSTVDLEGHVQAGSQAVLESLTKYARAGRPAAEPTPLAGLEMLSSLGTPVAVPLETDSPAVGRTLAELHLRGRTGATVLAIARGSESIVTPPPSEQLRAGDLVALAGTHEAIAAATALLRGRPPEG
jgi:CPA2 family monovalent cation:H+ antiporter-2